MPLALIYARSRNYCIGCSGALPWRLPEEFAHFSRTTLGAVVIMGRKSYQDHNCELPGRRNIVVSRSGELELAPGVERAGSLEQALAMVAGGSRETFVIGGVGLYREALPLARTVYETVVDAHIDGDTYIDAFDFSTWHSEELLQHPTDARHRYAFTVYRHSR